MLYAMLRHSVVGNVKVPPSEMRAVSAKAPTKHLITKRPLDIFEIDDVIAHAKEQDKVLKFIFIVRDQRSVLVSRHVGYRHQPFIGPEHSFLVGPQVVSFSNPGLVPVGAAVEAARGRTDIDYQLVRFEDLVRDPEGMRRKLAEFTGLRLEKPFSDFETSEIPDRLLVPLNGVRSVDKSRLESWRNSNDAARIVRQFRLAPRLFDHLEAWGYESNRIWYDKLRESTPRGLDDTPGTVVAYHTDDPLYEGEARRLVKSIERLRLPFEITVIDSQGSWLANIRFMVEFLRQARQRLDGPILYVDVDAVLQSDPWPYLRGCEGDVAFVVMRDGLARSGTVLIADTPGSLVFLEDWAERLRRDPKAWDQHPLTDVVNEHREEENPRYKVEILPPTMFYVFDRGETMFYPFDRDKLDLSPSEPIIEHFQASRELEERRGTLSGQARLARRLSRVREIEQQLEDISRMPSANAVSPAALMAGDDGMAGDQENLLSLLLGIAVTRYGYSLETHDGDVAIRIADDLRQAGLALDHSAVTRYLDMASARLGGDGAGPKTAPAFGRRLGAAGR